MSNNAPDYHDNLFIDSTRADYRYNGIYYAIQRLEMAMLARNFKAYKVYDYMEEAIDSLKAILKKMY